MSGESEVQDKVAIISELARRRGFFWQSYEAYGGVSGFATYGFLGTRLKQNIERKLKDLFVTKVGVLEVESPIITPAKVFEASGHVEHFKEPMVECSKCRKRFRADHLLQECAGTSGSEAERLDLKELQAAIEKADVSCPECGGAFGEPKYFLTMFQTTIGPYSEAVAYGRPEAAQGIFVEFKRLYEIAREKLPFGALQIGRALRNEISPRQSLIRLREFTIADLEFFFDPEQPNCYLLDEVAREKLRFLLAAERQKGSEKIIEATVTDALRKGYVNAEWQAVFMALAKRLLVGLGVSADKQRFIEKLPWERAHYSLQSYDQEVYVERWGWVEVSGHAYRTDYDLKCHDEQGCVEMSVYKEYEKPVEREQVTVKPIMAKLGPVFKGEAGQIAEKLSNADPNRVADSLKAEGYFLLDKHKVLPEQVQISHEKIIERGKRFIPHVVEPSFGSDRLVYVALEYAYQVKDKRAVLSLPRDVAPVQVGVYPLVNKDGLPEEGKEIQRMLLDEGFMSEYDEAGSIGRRYARADEIGVPLGITIDYETLKDNKVTIRDRDSWNQVRTKIDDLPRLLQSYFRWKAEFEQLGEPINT